MNLEVIKKLSENRDGGLKRLASDIGMSEQNLHRCIRNNKIQADVLEKAAILLHADIGEFFDDCCCQRKEITMDFSLLNHLINESKMGKAQIAEAAKISRTTLDNALNGADMKISTVESLAKVLGVNPGVFFGVGNNAKVETNGDFSPASMHGNVTVGAEAVLAERVKSLEALLAEKERLIKVYEKLTEGR